MKSALPPGPRMPVVLQSLGFWTRPIAFWESAGARYGQRFTFRLVGMPPLVAISDPEEIKEIFLAPPDVLHPGEGTRLLGILGPIVGPNSVTLQDGEAHLKQRRLLLPAFHGERIQRLEGLVAQLAEREVDTWAQGEPISLHGRLHQLTLEIILRAVFGLEEGARLDELRKLLTEVLAITESPLSLLPPLSPVLARFGAPARLERRAARVGEMIFALIDARRAARGGEDVLALLLDAEHEDGSPMSAEQVRDELMTALVAGHETTASQLAWTFERISREPAVLARLYEELDDGVGDEYLTATIQEALRRRPVLPAAQPRLVKKPVEIGGVLYPPGVVLLANAHLVHHDPEVYPDPRAFRPERFLEREGGQAPGTYTWIPFGGGRRRCLGVSFALLEMKVVLRTVLSRFEIHPASARPERARRRSITLSPARGGEVILRQRRPRTGSPAPGLPARMAAATAGHRRR